MFYFGVVWMAMSGGKTVKFLKKIFRNFLTFEILDFSTVKSPNNALAATARDWASILLWELHSKIYTELTGQVYRNIYVRPGVIMTLICMACGFRVLGNHNWQECSSAGVYWEQLEYLSASLSLFFSLPCFSFNILSTHVFVSIFLYLGFSSFFPLSGCAWCEILPEHQKKPDY